jgi:hypothetical protein
MKHSRIVTVAKVWHGAKWPLNEGQSPSPNVVRVVPGTGYHRVEGNRRASRNGRVSDPPPETADFPPSLQVVYMPTCVTRTMGPARGDEQTEPVHDKLLSLFSKAGYEVSDRLRAKGVEVHGWPRRVATVQLQR